MINHRRSSLVRGGLEICIQIEVKIEYNSQNKDAILRYIALVSQYYKKPVKENFEDISATILYNIDCDTDEEADDEPSIDNTN